MSQQDASKLGPDGQYPGGGLQSSPNVPRPGATIDPNTGKPHVAGLTRAELQAKREAEAAAKAASENQKI